MKNPKVKHYDVSTQCYQTLIDYMSQKGGVRVKDLSSADTYQCQISGDNTEMNLTHDPKEQSLLIEYIEVPIGLETYYWGHSCQRIQVLKQSINE